MAFRFPTTTQPIFGRQESQSTFAFNQQNTMAQPHNPNKDSEIVSPPEESVSALVFSPSALPQNYLIAGSWDNQVRCWEVQQQPNKTWISIPKAQQSHQGPVLDAAWSGVSILTSQPLSIDS